MLTIFYLGVKIGGRKNDEGSGDGKIVTRRTYFRIFPKTHCMSDLRLARSKSIEKEIIRKVQTL